MSKAGAVGLIELDIYKWAAATAAAAAAAAVAAATSFFEMRTAIVLC